jgi:hypothetical protein
MKASRLLGVCPRSYSGFNGPFRDAGQGSMEGHTVGRDQSPKLILDPYPVCCSPPPQASSILHRTLCLYHDLLGGLPSG